MVLSFTPERRGIDQGILKLDELYPDPGDRARFEEKWPLFVAADPLLDRVAWRGNGDEIRFLTESLLPSEENERPPVLLVLGNPAPHSVLHGLPFSYEGNEREHRFWVALRETGFLRFRWDAGSMATWQERNEAVKQDLYSLNYESPFRLGIASYFSMPSPASERIWSGVAGLRRLFGARALARIATAEDERLAGIISTFNSGSGVVIAFQRDAYEGLRQPNDPPYNGRRLLTGLLEGRCKLDRGIPIFGGPPTRLMQSAAARTAMIRLRMHIDDEASS